MSRVKISLDHKRIRRSVWLVLAVSVLLGYSLQSAAGSVNYSMLMQSYAAVGSPPVFLEDGTAGSSTIYMNKTSAKVNVTAPVFDYVDNNYCDVDSSADSGTHSNFTAQQAGPDSTYETLKEENTEAIEDYVDQQSDIDSSSDLGSHDIFNDLKAIDSTYDNMTEVEVGGGDTWEWSETVPGGYTSTSSYTQYIFASDYAPSSSYTATRIGFYAFADPQNNPDVKLAIYNQSAGEPDQVLGETAIFQITGSGWFDVDLTTPVELSSGVTYSVAHITEDAPTTQWRYREAATPVSDYYTLTSWPDFDEGVNWDQSGSYRYGAYRVGYSTGGDYQLDLEVQFTNVIDFLPTEKLCIYTGNLGDEDLRVDYWNGTGWENLATDLTAYSCNEYIVSLTSANFTIRFKGGTESSDTTQDQWQIDASLLRVEGAGDKQNAVDQQSNADGSADVGTHSNFTAQQYYDGINDTLTEEDTGGGVTWYYAEALSEDSQTGTSWKTVCTLTVPGDGGNYLIFVQMALSGSSTASTDEIRGRLYVNSTDEWSYVTTEPDDAYVSGDERFGHKLFCVRVQQLNGDTEFDLDIRSEGALATTYSRYAVIVAIKLEESYDYNSAYEAGTLTLTTTTQDLVSDTISVGSTGHYLILASAECQIMSTADDQEPRFRLRVDGVVQGQYANPEGEGSTGGWENWFALKVVELNSGNRDISIRADAHGITNHYARRGRIFAMRLNGTVFSEFYYNEDDTETTTGNDFPTDRLTLQFTPTETSDFLIISSAIMGGDATSGAFTEFSMDVDGTDRSWMQLGESDDSDRLPFGGVYNTSLDTSSHTIKLEYGETVGDNPTPDPSLGTCRIFAVKMPAVSPTNYELDLEVRWTDLPYLLPNENLSIYGGTMGDEDIEVDVWNGTDWETVFTDLSSGWNNASITDWLTTSNVTIRFKGGNETEDPSEDTWQIDVALIHIWHEGGESYKFDLEVQWTSSEYTRTNEELCIKTGTFSGSENIQVKVRNNTGSSWHWVMNLTASQWNNVSITSYLTSNTFTVQFLGGTETGDTNKDSWNIDATLLHAWTSEGTYDHVLEVVNQKTDNWTVNLQVYDSSNVDRLSSLNISLHDGTSSNQIAIKDGSIVKSEGEPDDLPGGSGSTIYISMNNIEASTSGTSYLYVYLKILVPDTSTYMLYIITFEIT